MQSPVDEPSQRLAICTAAIARSPESAAAYHSRAILLYEFKAYDQALVDHRRAVALAPGELPVHLAMIETNRAKGDFSQAEKDCRAVAALHGKSARLWEVLGKILQTVGRFDEAGDCFRRSLSIQPSGAVSMLLATTPGAVQVDELQRMVNPSDATGQDERDRAAAGFAMGDVLDRAGRYDEAFTAYAGANALFRDYSLRRGEFFGGEDLRQKVDEMIGMFSPEYFQQRDDFGHKTELPVFVVGMPRSGTSLVEQIFASHSRVFGAGELPEIAMIRARMAQTVPADSPRPLHRHWHRHLGKVHTARLQMQGGEAARVVDKMPANILHLGLIATMLPGARVIFCQRDPRDTCLSCYFQLFEKFNLMFSYDLADCAMQYRQQERLAAHWRKVLPLRMLSVQYEELVSDIEVQSRRMIDFMGLDWEPGCLEFYRNSRAVQTRSVWQVRQPVYSGSVGRWKNYERQIPQAFESFHNRNG